MVWCFRLPLSVLWQTVLSDSGFQKCTSAHAGIHVTEVSAFEAELPEGLKITAVQFWISALSLHLGIS